MAAQTVQHPASGRYVKAYLLTWGILASGGLGYLGTLAWQPELFTAPPPPQVTQPDQGLRAATRALAELGSVRRTMGDMQRDISQIRETVEQREAREKALHSRVAAIEERVANPPPIAAAPETQAPEQPKVAGKAKTEKSRKAAETRLGRVISVTEAPAEQPAAVPPPPAAKSAPPPPPAIETGSIASPPVIAFGAPVVTPAPARTYAVQLAAGPSLDALRVSWSLLVERHAALGELQPRFVPPRADGGGPYRLVAGPLTSKADADKVCADMGVGNKGCFVTTFIGQPL